MTIKVMLMENITKPARQSFQSCLLAPNQFTFRELTNLLQKVIIILMINDHWSWFYLNYVHKLILPFVKILKCERQHCFVKMPHQCSWKVRIEKCNVVSSEDSYQCNVLKHWYIAMYHHIWPVCHWSMYHDAWSMYNHMWSNHPGLIIGIVFKVTVPKEVKTLMIKFSNQPPTTFEAQPRDTRGNSFPEPVAILLPTTTI